MLKRLTADRFDQIYHIMEQSFPRNERRPREEQRELFDRDCYKVFGMIDESDEVIGFIAVWDLGSVAFIEHFAVSPTYRNGGIGGRMLTELLQTIGKPACLEVELPDTDLARRRIGFYQRNGLVFNAYDYLQPPLSKGQDAVPLRLMTSEGKVSQERFEELKSLLYRLVYEAQAPLFGKELI